MDDMTQRNSSMADQSAGVARELQQATASLRQMVENFKVAGAPVRSLEASVMAELRQAAPHMAQARAGMAHAAPRPQQRRAAGGGATGGWSEF